MPCRPVCCRKTRKAAFTPPASSRSISTPTSSDYGQTHEYAYTLTNGSGVSEVTAVNDHQFLVDERDGNGMADTTQATDTASTATVKQLFEIDLTGAQQT